MKPGYSVSLHSHKMVEVFIPVSGEWRFFWGEKGEEGVELGPLDAISFPAGLMEGSAISAMRKVSCWWFSARRISAK